MNFDLLHALGGLLYAQTQTQAPPSPTGMFTSMFPLLIAFVAIMYFLTIRPQQKRERERRDMLSSLSKGDKVVTTGGICGEVVGLGDSHVVLRVDDNCKIEFVKAAIAQVAPRDSKDSK